MLANIPMRQKILVMLAAMSGLLLAALDQTIVSTALPRIVSDLHGLKDLSWVVTAYLLTSTIAVPISGRLNLRAGMAQIQRWQARVRPKLYDVGIHFEARVQRAILMRCGVVISERDQRPQFQRTYRTSRGAGRAQLVLNRASILTVKHANRLLQLEPLDLVYGNGEGVLPELFEQEIALWMDRSRITVRR